MDKLKALEKLRAKGLVLKPQDSFSEASFGSSTTAVASTPSEASKPAVTLDSITSDVKNITSGLALLSMGNEAMQNSRSTAGGRKTAAEISKTAPATKDTTAPRTVTTIPKKSQLSADAKSWNADNYTTEQPNVKGWSTEEQFPLKQESTPVWVLTTENKVKSPVGEPATATPFAPVTTKRAGKAPEKEGQAPPHLRRTNARNEYIDTAAPHKTTESDQKSTKTEAKQATTSQAAKNSYVVDKGIIKIPDESVRIVPMAKVDKSSLAKDTCAPAQHEDVKAFKTGKAGPDNDRHDKRAVRGSEGTAAASASKADEAAHEGAQKSMMHTSSAELKDSSLQETSDALTATDKQQQTSLNAQIKLYQQVKEKLAELTAINDKQQGIIAALEASLMRSKEIQDGHCDRLIHLETMMEAWKNFGTDAFSKVPFVVKVQYPDNSTEEIQTFGAMRVSSLLERIMRRKKISVNDKVRTASLSYLGEKLGHLSFVGENDILQDSVLYFDLT
ncbi:hypothetical protein AMS68_007882 [Peltaster fructicola]|uniref:Uncharacterized protein n=1 Tax=Peltaster fructicola TaxID=286661 RepID=A0A6H0Y640_9PEZI|nr:hypothetical protein AMS68_007882 [Peltaster fructicola]